MNGSWQRYRPSPDRPWNLRRVVLLHRRAGFGATWRELQRDLADGPEASVERVLEGTSRHDTPQDFDEISARLAQGAHDRIGRLQAWWIYRMLYGGDPLTERLALLWHNHFATSHAKVQSARLMWQQNETLRRHARGRFGDLLHAMLRDPALLVWLDADQNVAGRPNENLARELLELFTLGRAAQRGRESFSRPTRLETFGAVPAAKKTPDPFSHYTEQDVKEVARALTGWSVTRGEFRERLDQHEDGQKTILGESGNFRAPDIADILLAHPATARRLAWRICDCLLAENLVTDEAVDALAAGLSEHDLDIDWAVATVLRSERFYSNENVAAKVLGPVDLAVGTVRGLELHGGNVSTMALADWTALMGQELFAPPNVGGWKGGRHWLDTRTTLARMKFAHALAHGELARKSGTTHWAEWAERHGEAPSAEGVVELASRALYGCRPRDDVRAAIEQLSTNGELPSAGLAALLTAPSSQLF